VDDSQVAGYALVVGCQGEGLHGTDHDVSVMAAMLRSRCFDVDVRTGDRAKRADILAGYNDVIAKVSPGQAAVVYYTGHGWYAFRENEAVPWQGIRPTDMDETTTEDFRGITSWELSILQRKLTERTKNVTIILDCCHAAQMSRDAATAGAVCRALPHPARVGFQAHLDALRARYGDAFAAVRSGEGNRDAVRLVACRQDQCAFEDPVDGQYRGVFTDALLDVLREVADAPLSWASLDAGIRERVQRRHLLQRPDIEGRAERIPFSLAIGTRTNVVTIEARPSGFRIGAGQLTQVVRGDVYGVMPQGAVVYDTKSAIARVRIAEPSATYAAAELLGWDNGHACVPAGAVAIAIEKQVARRAVTVVAQESARHVIDAEISATPNLRPATGGEATALPVLRLSNGMLAVEDELGALFPPARFPEDLQRAIVHLSDLGAAQALRDLVGDHGVPASAVEIESGSVVRGKMRKMPPCGGMLALRDRFYVKVTSQVDHELYVHIFNIGLAGEIMLLTKHIAPGGVRLCASRPRFVLGEGADGTLHGIALGWPDRVMRNMLPRLDQYVVIVTSTNVNLRCLETGEDDVAARGLGPGLYALLSQVRGRSRSLKEAQPIDGYYMECVSYYLCPQDARISDVPFAIDENPLRQALVCDRDAWIAPVQASSPAPDRSNTIRIRIVNLVVDDSQPSSSEKRLDALICTRSLRGPGFATWTWRPPVNDVACLDASGATLFQGDVHDFVEIYLWMSEDANRSPELEHLLAQCVDTSIIDGAAQVLSLNFRAPRVAAVAASAALAQLSDETLVAATRKCSGLYRASFGWQMNFGMGVPMRGTHHARGRSLALCIDHVSELTGASAR
jgi:caspase domain-containing protein